MIKSTMGRATQIKRNVAEIGETIEVKFERIMNNGEPISEGAPLIFNERKDGAQPEYDIRTDRFEIAVMGTDAIDKSIKAKRENKAKEFAKKDDKVESTATTE